MQSYVYINPLRLQALLHISHPNNFKKMAEDEFPPLMYTDRKGEFKVYTFDSTSGFVIRCPESGQILLPGCTLRIKTDLVCRPVSYNDPDDDDDVEAVLFNHPSMPSYVSLYFKQTFLPGEAIEVRLHNFSKTNTFELSGQIIARIFVVRNFKSYLKQPKEGTLFVLKNETITSDIYTNVICYRRVIEGDEEEDGSILFERGPESGSSIITQRCAFTKTDYPLYTYKVGAICQWGDNKTQEYKDKHIKTKRMETDQSLTKFSFVKVDVSGKWCIIQPAATNDNLVHVEVDFYGVYKPAWSLLNKITTRHATPPPNEMWIVTHLSYLGPTKRMLDKNSVWYDTNMTYCRTSDSYDTCGMFVFCRTQDGSITMTDLYCPPQFFMPGERIIIEIKNMAKPGVNTTLDHGRPLGYLVSVHINYMRKLLKLGPLEDPCAPHNQTHNIIRHPGPSDILTTYLTPDPGKYAIKIGNLYKHPCRAALSQNDHRPEDIVDVIMPVGNEENVLIEVVPDASNLISVMSSLPHLTRKAQLLRVEIDKQGGYFTNYTLVPNASPSTTTTTAEEEEERFTTTTPCGFKSFQSNDWIQPHSVEKIRTSCFLQAPTDEAIKNNLVCLLITDPIAASLGLSVEPSIVEWNSEIVMNVMNLTNYPVDIKYIILGRVYALNKNQAEMIIQKQIRITPPIYETKIESNTGRIINRGLRDNVMEFPLGNARVKEPFQTRLQTMHLQGGFNRLLFAYSAAADTSDHVQIIPCLYPADYSGYCTVELSAVLLKKTSDNFTKAPIQLLNIEVNESFQLNIINRSGHSIVYKDDKLNFKPPKLSKFQHLNLADKALPPINLLHPIPCDVIESGSSVDPIPISPPSTSSPSQPVAATATTTTTTDTDATTDTTTPPAAAGLSQYPNPPPVLINAKYPRLINEGKAAANDDDDDAVSITSTDSFIVLEEDACQSMTTTTDAAPTIDTSEAANDVDELLQPFVPDEDVYPWSSITPSCSIKRVSHCENAGVDIKTGSEYVLEPGVISTINTNTIMHLAFESLGYIMGRSSAHKRGLYVYPTTVFYTEDPEPISVKVLNTSDKPITLKPTDCIMQMIVMPLYRDSTVTLFYCRSQFEDILKKYGRALDDMKQIEVKPRSFASYTITEPLNDIRPLNTVLFIGRGSVDDPLFVFPGVIDSNYTGPIVATILNRSDELITECDIVNGIDVPILPAYMWERITDDVFFYNDSRAVYPYSFMERNYLIDFKSNRSVPSRDELVGVCYGLLNEAQVLWQMENGDPYEKFNFAVRYKNTVKTRKKIHRKHNKPYSRLPLNCKFVPDHLTERKDRAFGSSGHYE